VIEKNSKPLCLICGECISICKTYNIRRHYVSLHKIDFENLYPLDSAARKQHLKQLKSSLTGQQNLLKSAMNETKLTTLASFKISWLLAQHKKPFSDSEIVKSCILESMKILLEGSKEKEAILSRISKLQLSRFTVSRRVTEISSDLESQLASKMSSCLAFSLALDESTDIKDVAQLCIWVRFVDESLIAHEEMLKLKSLCGRTRGQDIYDAVSSTISECAFDCSKFVSVTTDGAPAMTGKNCGAVSLLKLDYENLISFHCIIHQEALCSKISSGRLSSVMNTVSSIVNVLKANALNHRQFVEFLDSLNSDYPDLLMHTEIRWLSRGRVLERFIALLPEINDFLDLKNIHTFDNYLCDVQWVRDLCFLNDICHHLNELNLTLQGNNIDLVKSIRAINCFISKLDFFSTQLHNNQLRHFPELQKSILEEPAPEYSSSSHVEWIGGLKTQFAIRFSDFSKMKVVVDFMENPLKFKIQFVEELAKVFNVNCAELENDFLSFQSENHSEPLDWKVVTQKSLRLIFAKASSIFSSTYTCEQTFSTMSLLKSNLRSQLSNSNLENGIRCAVTSFKPNLEGLCLKKNCQISH